MEKSRPGLKPVLILLVSPLLLFSQEKTRRIPTRPTIGVALEGGGAKGLAHIGVLRWFEEHHIPVDYIAGTSMGGLVGGLYATGHRAAELQEIVSKIDWNQVLAGETPYRDLSFRRKEDLRAYPNGLEIGLRNGLSLPGGLTSGQSVRVLLDRYMLPYSKTERFDDLPIPFRCVATDLVSGKAVVFSTGSLATALRATMSIPGVFAPLRIDGKIYADGALMDNLPTDVVRQMGADVVIGVHLNIGPNDPDKLRTLLQVAGGSTGVMIDANVLRGMELADVLLTIDVSGFSTLDFSRADKIIPKGYEAANSKLGILKRFSVNDEDWDRHLTARESRRLESMPEMSFVEVGGIRKQLAADVSKKLASHSNQPLDTTRLESDLSELVGIGRFNSLTYSLVDRNGKTGLLINAEEKDYAPPWLKPGFVIDGSDIDDVGFTLASRLTFLDVGGYRSELRTDFAIGSRYEVRTEYYHPFTPATRWFIAPQAGAARTPFNLYSKGDLLAEYRVNSINGGIDIGYNFDRFSEVRIGYDVGYLSATRRIGSEIIPSVSGRTGNTRLRFGMDRLDNPIIPRQGTAVLSTAQWTDTNPGGQKAFPSAETSIVTFYPVSRAASVYGLAAGGTTFGYDQTGLPRFWLGSPSRLAAYGLNEILTDQYWYLRLGYLRQVAALPAFLGGKVYMTAHYELAKPYKSQSSSTLPNDGVMGILTETLFGPVMIGGSIGDRGHRKFFFQLGKVF
jgi:NTE family protein